MLLNDYIHVSWCRRIIVIFLFIEFQCLGFISIKNGNDFSFQYLNFSKQVVKVIPSQVVAEITNYQYEVKLNDEKRRIRVLKSEYLSAFISEHREIMTYDKSSDYIAKRLKGTYNPRISGV